MPDLRAQFAANPGGFIRRQLYRVFVIAPFVGVLRVWNIITNVLYKAPAPQVPYLVFVTSVIYPSMSKAVSFGAVRSTYTPAERLEHTKASIASIRTHIPQAHIVLVEGGLTDVGAELRGLVDTYLYIGDRPGVRRACDGTSKSLGEAVMLYVASKQVSVTATYYFKLSGRYTLNDSFDLKTWGQTGFSFLVLRPDFFSTRLYGFSGDMFLRWQQAIIMGMPYHIMDYPVENTMMRFVSRQWLHRRTHLGVSGLGGSSYDQIHE